MLYLNQWTKDFINSNGYRFYLYSKESTDFNKDLNSVIGICNET